MSLKDSGVEWISSIPIEWEVKKLKYLAEIIDGDRGSEYPNDKDLVDVGILFLSGDNLKSNGFDYSKVRFISEEKFSKLGRGKVMKNDIITSVRGTIGSAGLFEGEVYEKAFINAQMMIIRPRKILDSKFLFYFTRTNAWKLCLNYFAYGTAQQQLSNKILMQLPLAIPNLKIQHQIVNYLDNKICKVDKLIEKKEQLVSMLEQQRQSIITEAVTKGLNPNVKMKDSGVEWIGEIPEHWNISKVKYTSYLLNGDRGENYPSGNDFLDDGIPFITSHNLNKRYIDYTNCKYISDERYNLLRGIKIENRDIIYCLRGSVGKNAMATHSEGTIASSLMGIRAKNNINPEFLLYVLNSKVEVWNRSLLTTGSVSDNLSAENVGSYIIPYPDLEEQERIVSYLIKKLNELDKLSDIVEIQIEKLKEYRQALIYEAVTGKINISDMEFV
ncbi:hypothetical protein EIJ82_17315 [Alkalihalobacillus clausii]|nr:hypothetical protein [Shouchella clausii]